MNRPLEKSETRQGNFRYHGTLFLHSTLAPKPALAFHATLIRPCYEPTPTDRHEWRTEENIGTCGRFMRLGETDILTGL